jgi:LuxR family maltose regulon positive regulatory protein
MPSRGHGPSTISTRAHRLAVQPTFALLESKLHPPDARPGIVARTDLVGRLLDASAVPIISVVAPAGYGKTTLLAQWAACREPRVAWVSVDVGDNDPAVLLSYLAAALDRIEPIDPGIFRALASTGARVTSVTRLVSAIGSMAQPISLVLDNAEALTNSECRHAVADLARYLPPGSQLAVGSRDELSIPAARLRVEGRVVEIRASDLAMTEREAPFVLDSAGVDLDDAELHDLVRRTEGWPAGLYLAALALKAGASGREAGYAFAGDDRFIGDYLHAELLDRLSNSEVEFLTRTSVLDRLCGPLCDALLEAKGSGVLLEHLETRNLFVVPLDRQRQWYRYHHLFRDLLHAELVRREPALVPRLHARAAAWCEANDLAETAIEHAQAAGDADLVARLVLDLAQPVWASGRVDTVLRWMEWLDDAVGIERYPEIAVHGALTFALLGRSSEAERWAAAAERGSPEGVLPDGSTMQSSLAYLRALLARHGIEEMRRDAEASWSGLSPSSPYRATILHTEGVAYLLEGEGAQADPIFARAFDEAIRAGAEPLAAMVLAERGIVAIERDDWREAEAFAAQAQPFLHGGDFDDYWTSALVYAWLARVSVHRGDVASAQTSVGRAARLRPLLTYVLPIVSVQSLLELARAYIGLADPGGARTVLRQVNDIVQHRPELGVLVEQARRLRATVDTLEGGAVGASSLTAAELRLLPLLSTHLSLAEIGERLYVSRNTVKTQAVSIYRKLGVSSRSAAISRMNELGLHAGFLSEG